MNLGQLCRKTIIKHMEIGSDVPDINDNIDKWAECMFDRFEYDFHISVRKLILDCIINGTSSRLNIGKSIFNQEIRNAANLFSLDIHSIDSKDGTPRCCPVWHRVMKYYSILTCYSFSHSELLNTIDITLTRPEGWNLKIIEFNTTTLLLCAKCKKTTIEQEKKVQENRERKLEREKRKEFKRECRDLNREFRKNNRTPEQTIKFKKDESDRYKKKNIDVKKYDESLIQLFHGKFCITTEKKKYFN